MPVQRLGNEFSGFTHHAPSRKWKSINESIFNILWIRIDLPTIRWEPSSYKLSAPLIFICPLCIMIWMLCRCTLIEYCNRQTAQHCTTSAARHRHSSQCGMCTCADPSFAASNGKLLKCAVIMMVAIQNVWNAECEVHRTTTKHDDTTQPLISARGNLNGFVCERIAYTLSFR